MFYQAGTESSWTGLSAAISTFCVTTMGSYTQIYNNGLSMDGSATNVLCLQHTATSMYYMWDSGPADDSGNWGDWEGVTGESFVANLQCTTQDVSIAFGSHNNLAWNGPITADDFANGQTSCSSFIPFAGGVKYWFFGDKPAEDGEDYFHMVLEIQSGVYVHFRTGRVTPALTELAYTTNYGTFTSSTNLIGDSYGRAQVRVPYCWSYQRGSTLHFPQGTTSTDIDITPHNQGAADDDLREDWSGAIGASGFSHRYGPNVILANAGTSSITGRVILAPDLCILSDVGGDYTIPANMVYCGTFPGAWCISMDTVLPEEVVSIGSSDYIVFPMLRAPTAASGILAFPGATTWVTSPPGADGSLGQGACTGWNGFVYRKT